MLISTEEQKLRQALDRDKPTWFIDWAEQRDFQDALRCERNMPLDQFLKTRVISRLAHPIINAAIEAGIVKVAS